MDHLKILKRSWEVLWNYKALWVFGVILAIASAGGTAGGGGNSGAQFSGNGNQNSFQPFETGPGMQGAWEEGWREFGLFFSQDIPNAVGTTLIALGIAFACILVLLGIATFILGYMSRTALIRMVDEYEETEERRTVKEGFRIGWSRTTWRLFLIDLVVNLPIIIVFLILFLLSLSPLLLWFTQNNAAEILGTVAAVGIFFLVILLVLLVSTVVTVLRRFFHRACALQELGVFASIAEGYRIVRRNLKDTALMWLILLGLQIAYGIGVAVFAFILLLPAVLIAGIAALLFGGLGALIGGEALPWIMGGVVGIPLFLLLFALPLTFLSGLKEVYINNAWTLTYREMTALNGQDMASSEMSPQVEEENGGDTAEEDQD